MATNEPWRSQWFALKLTLAGWRTMGLPKRGRSLSGASRTGSSRAASGPLCFRSQGEAGAHENHHPPRRQTDDEVPSLRDYNGADATSRAERSTHGRRVDATGPNQEAEDLSNLVTGGFDPRNEIKLDLATHRMAGLARAPQYSSKSGGRKRRSSRRLKNCVRRKRN